MTTGPGFFRGRSLGMLLLCLFLIVYGILGFVEIHYAGLILSILALAAGIVLLFLG